MQPLSALFSNNLQDISWRINTTVIALVNSITPVKVFCVLNETVKTTRGLFIMDVFRTEKDDNSLPLLASLCVGPLCCDSYSWGEDIISNVQSHILDFFLLSFSYWSWWDISKLHNSKCFWQTPKKSNKFVKAVELICDQIFHSPAFISFVFHSYPSLISLFALPFSCSAASSLVVDVVLDVLFFPLAAVPLAQVFGVSSVTFALSRRRFIELNEIWGCCEMWFLQVTCSAAPRRRERERKKWETWNDKRNKFI